MTSEFFNKPKCSLKLFINYFLEHWIKHGKRLISNAKNNEYVSTKVDHPLFNLIAQTEDIFRSLLFIASISMDDFLKKNKKIIKSESEKQSSERDSYQKIGDYIYRSISKCIPN